MATYQELVNSIDSLLGLNIAGQTLQLNSNAREKAFEVYILSLIVEAVQQAGGSFEIVGILSGTHPNPVVFRAAPGTIYSRLQNFAYIDCELNGYEFEIHVDIEFEGGSGATHEVDISLIDKRHADKSRSADRNPKYPLYIFESKFYSTSTPSTIIARTLVGLKSDFYTRIGCALVSNDGTDNLKTYLSRQSRPEPFLDLDPQDHVTEENFIANVRQNLRRWAHV